MMWQKSVEFISFSIEYWRRVGLKIHVSGVQFPPCPRERRSWLRMPFFCTLPLYAILYLIYFQLLELPSLLWFISRGVDSESIIHRLNQNWINTSKTLDQTGSALFVILQNGLLGIIINLFPEWMALPQKLGSLIGEGVPSWYLPIITTRYYLSNSIFFVSKIVSRDRLSMLHRVDGRIVIERFSI